MKSFKLMIFALTVLVFAACSVSKPKMVIEKQVYIPDSQELYDKIVSLDSIYFNAYNTCDMALQDSFYADNIEFYHDKSGLSTSKKDLLEGLKNNICGKVTRELVKGSIEVYPLKGFGAVEMGSHKFHNNQEPSDTPSEIGKFIIIWKQTGEKWQISRVVSLH
ncbi:MAG: nuclear transport factor 2 family protein [Daejeonella sp.]